jgi:hypothetical protein
MKQYEPLPPLRLNGPVYGYMLMFATLLTTIVVAHHPAPDLHDHARAMANIAAVSEPERWMHGGVSALAILFCVAYSGFAWRLGIEHPLVVAGWLCYVFGTFALLLAALNDGFIIPDLAARFAADPAAHPWGYDMIAACGLTLQALAKLGLVLIGFALVLWAHALAHHRGMARWMAALAFVTGGFSAAYILRLPGQIDKNGLFLLLVGQTVWNLAVAFWMIRGLRRPVAA